MVEMSSMILGQYKVIRVLHMQEDYAAVLAVDILDRMQTMRLINVYERRAARRYAAVFEGIRHCPEFVTARLAGESLIAVFTWRSAPLIDAVFYEKSGQDWRTRLSFAENLFRLVLSVWDQPSELGCSAMQSDNLCASLKDHALFVNYCIVPMTKQLPQREIICLAADQARKILYQTRKTVLSERIFLFDLTHGRWKDAITLNSAWNQAKVQITEEYERLENQLMIGRLASRLKTNLRWKKEQKRRTYGKRW